LRSKDFLGACEKGELPDYCFVEPNYNDHEGDDGEELASISTPTTTFKPEESFICYHLSSHQKQLLILEVTSATVVYDEHGGTYDHVPPPACTPDGFVARQRHGIASSSSRSPRRPRSRHPYLSLDPKGTVIDGRIFDTLPSLPPSPSISSELRPASPREKAAETFRSITVPALRDDCSCF